MISSQHEINQNMGMTSTALSRDNQSLINQSKYKSIIKIGQPNQSLYSLLHNNPKFYQYLCLCVFNILKQWHTIYFILLVVAKSFYLCQYTLGSSISQIVLIIIYFVLEMVLRYRTFTQYVRNCSESNYNKYKVWAKKQEKWIQKTYDELIPGEIIKLNSVFQNRSIKAPVTILPMKLSSQKNYLQIKTTSLNKQESIKKISIMSNFHKIFKQKGERTFSFTNKQGTDIIQKEFYQYQIVFNYPNLEPRLLDKEGKYNIEYSIVHKGEQIVREDFMIGIVLVQFQDKHNIKHCLNINNKINVQFRLNLIFMIVITIIITFTITLGEFIFITSHSQFKQTLNSLPGSILCMILNIMAICSYFVYIGMFIFLFINRLMDVYRLFKSTQIRVNNAIKSIQQFGQVNTMIMDDYFFINKDHFRIQNKIFYQATQYALDQYLLMKIIEQSQAFKDQMYDLWISLSNNYRMNIQNRKQQKYKVKVISQKVTNSSSYYSTIILDVQLNIQHSNIEGQKKKQFKKYQLFISEQPKKAPVKRIQKVDIKEKVKKQIQRLQMSQINKFRFLMIGIREIRSNSTSFELQAFSQKNQSIDYSQKFKFLMLITFSIQKLDFSSADMINFIKQKKTISKNNIIIMSKKKWKYLHILLQKNGFTENQKIIQLTQRKKQKKINGSNNMKNIIFLQEKDKQSIIYDLDCHLKKLKQAKNLIQSKLMNKKQINYKKTKILSINRNFIRYLNYPEIAEGLVQLIKYSKYIIFDDCSDYDKQLCRMSLFQMFPFHVLLTNYANDVHLIEKSNLSVCENGASSSPYVTLVVQSYQNLTDKVFLQGAKSINISVFIIKSFLFKNTILILCLLITEFLVYQGKYYVLGLEYDPLVFIIYNFITSLTIIYHIFARPDSWLQSNENKYNNLFSKRFYLQLIRSIVIAIIISFVNFSFLMSNAIENVFFSLLTACVIASGYYQLLIDCSKSKKIPILLFIIQVLMFLMLIYFLELWNDQGFQLAVIETNITTKDTVYFFIANLIILPLILGFVFYGMALLNFQPQIKVKDKKQVVARILEEDFGKQLRFKNLDQ